LKDPPVSGFHLAEIPDLHLARRSQRLIIRSPPDCLRVAQCQIAPVLRALGASGSNCSNRSSFHSALKHCSGKIGGSTEIDTEIFREFDAAQCSISPRKFSRLPRVPHLGKASPLQGVAQGVAFYQNGVRVNEAFGDTVNWDAVPQVAIARMDVWSSNPVLGLNALGGAVNAAARHFPAGPEMEAVTG